MLSIIKSCFDISKSSPLAVSGPVRCFAFTTHCFSRPDFRSSHSFSDCLRRSLNILFHDGVNIRFLRQPIRRVFCPDAGLFSKGRKTEKETCNFEQMH